jgi:hypothetical protein
MFTANYWKSRFNLLYLHESEVKTDEHDAKWYFVDSERGLTVKEEGILHIGSKCLYLESMKENYPILKFLMKNFIGSLSGQGIL